VLLFITNIIDKKHKNYYQEQKQKKLDVVEYMRQVKIRRVVEILFVPFIRQWFVKINITKMKYIMSGVSSIN